MQSKWLVCAMLGTLALAQAKPAAPPTAPEAAPAVEVAPNAAVLTIEGFCPSKATESKTAPGSKVPTKTADAKLSANCKTVVTRAQFEKLANGVAPTLTPQLKRQLANVLPRLMVMSQKAETKGLQNSPRFTETLRFARMQILTNELQRSVQEDAAKVPDADIRDYYQKNPEAFQQFSLDRIFIPNAKQAAEENDGDGDADEAKDPDKDQPTDEKEKARQTALKAKQEENEQAMNKLAVALRERAVAGDDFTKLQKEAFDAAGMKIDNPTINMPKVRRTGLPQGQSAVFALKASEVSQVISDPGGHYIYRVNKQELLGLDVVKDEIHTTLQNQRMKDGMDKLQNSFKSDVNESYFGAAGGPMRGVPPPHLPRPVNPSGVVQPVPAPTPRPSTPGAQPPAAKPN